MATACFHTSRESNSCDAITSLGCEAHSLERSWYAISTLPRNEQSVARYLDANQIESFLPTCESVRRWRNRQNVTVVEALFPTYVFARIHKSEQSSVLRSPRSAQNCRQPQRADRASLVLRLSFYVHVL